MNTSGNNTRIIRSAGALRTVFSAALCLAAACLASCGGGNIFDPMNVDEKEEVYTPVVGEPGEYGVISIHEIVRHKRGDEKEYEVSTMFGDEVFIDKNQLLDSSGTMSATRPSLPIA